MADPYARLAELARRLAAADELEAAVAAMRSAAPAVVHADAAEVELVDGRRPAAAIDAGRGLSAAVPLIGDDGQALGVLRLAWHMSVVFDPQTRALIHMLGQLCAQSVVRIRAAERAAALARLVTAMAAARTEMDVARLFTVRGPALLGAKDASLHMLDGMPLLDSYAARAAGDGVAVWSAGEGIAAIPIRGADGTLVAVGGFTWSEPIAFDQHLRAVATSLAHVAGAALERARRYDREHATLAALQRHLVGRPATVDGVEVAARYLPGPDAVGMGGDWYDTVVREDGTLVIVIGDVAGHGVEAVATMAQLQYLISGQVRGARPLPEVFAAVNEMIGCDGSVYATAQLFHVDPPHNRLGYHNAGHPWALLRHRDGRVDRLDAVQHPPIGIPHEPQPLTYVDFPPGTLLLAYTDGLVERAEHSILQRIDRLATTFAAVEPTGDVDDILAEIVAIARSADDGGEPLDDDVAAVLVRG
jgi:hypothetical protein